MDQYVNMLVTGITIVLISGEGVKMSLESGHKA